MAYVLEHFLSDICCRKFQNESVSNNVELYANQFVDVKFGLIFDQYQLELQCTQFAKELFSRSSLRMYEIFNSKYYPEQVRNCKKMYVYSYAKALLYGLNYGDVRELPNYSYTFVGHGILQRLLARARFVHYSDEYATEMSLIVTRDQAKSITDELFKAYPWLENCVGADVASGFSFNDTFLEGCLNRLMQASNYMTEKSTHVYANQNFLEQAPSPGTEKKLSNEVNTQEKSEITVEQPPRETKITEKGVKIGNRFVEILPLNSLELDNFVTDAYLPLGNSAIDITDKNKWYYVFHPSKTIKYSLDYHICRALFIYLIPDESNNRIGKYNKIYDSLGRNYEYDSLVNLDVRAITYLKCSRPITRESSEPCCKPISSFSKDDPSPFDSGFNVERTRNKDKTDVTIPDSKEISEPTDYELEPESLKVVSKLNPEKIKEFGDEVFLNNVFDVLKLIPLSDLKGNLANYSLDLYSYIFGGGLTKFNKEPFTFETVLSDKDSLRKFAQALLIDNTKSFINPDNFEELGKNTSMLFTRDRRIGVDASGVEAPRYEFYRLLTLNILKFHDLIDDKVYASEIAKFIKDKPYFCEFRHVPGMYIFSKLRTKLK